MKKAIIILLVLLSCSVAFAGNLHVGVVQGVWTSAATVGYDFGRWADVGARAGIPVVSHAVKAISNACSEPKYNNDGKQTNYWKDDLKAMVMSPMAEVYGHLKLVDSRYIDLRLGASASFMGVGEEAGTSFILALRPEVELGWKVEDGFRLYVNGGFPVWPYSFKYKEPSIGANLGSVGLMIIDTVRIGASWTF